MLKRELFVGMFSHGSWRAGLGHIGARGRAVGLLAATGGLLALWALVLANSAAAALPSNCSASRTTVTCTFGYTGGAQTWTPPGGVTSATFDLFGAQGG